MRIYVVADMEGVAGVASLELQAHPGGPLYEQSRRQMTAEVAAAIAGARAGGADEVIVFDMHCDGLNLLLDELPAGARVIVGKPGGAMLHAGRLGPMDGLMLVGFHTRASNPNGMLAHTYTLWIRDMFLNGRPIGEVELECATAGSLGIPTLMVTGDSAMAREVRGFLPGAELVEVKAPLASSAGLTLLPRAAAARIRKAAARAVRRLPHIAPVRVKQPVELELVLGKALYAAGFVKAGFRRRAGRLVWRGPKLLDAYAAFIAGLQPNAGR